MTRLRMVLGRLPHWFALRGDSGSAGVEFALIAPAFILVIAGIFEIGLVIRAKFSLISVVSAASSHTLSVGKEVDDGSAASVAATIATLLGGGGRSATVNLNNAVTAHLEDGTVSVVDNGREAASCYCPSRSEGLIVWGGTLQCGASCADATASGRFVVITSEAPISAALGMSRLLNVETITDTAVVRLP